MKDLTGNQFGRLAVLHVLPARVNGAIVWRCRCSCGVECDVSGAYLRGGTTTSCGCLRRELGRARGAKLNLRHGEGRNGKETPEYRCWSNMLSRCENAGHQLYANYGARGITVCERWHTFELFLTDMGRRPSPIHSIDRIDNTLGYEPGNCRWATDVQQNRNTRSTRHITANGETHCIAEWARLRNIPLSSLYTRLNRAQKTGKSNEAVLGFPDP